MSQSEKNPIVQAVEQYRREANEARRDRLEQNKLNSDFYHQKQDWSHKKKGQSREFLPKQTMATEQITSFVHQGLVSLGEWFSVNATPGNKQPLLTEDEAEDLLDNQLGKAKFYTFIQDGVKQGLLNALMIAKVHGVKVDKPKYFTEKKKGFLGFITSLKKRQKQVWELRIDLIRARDYYVDPTGEGLYEMQDIEMDLWQLKKLAKEHPDVYDMSAINDLGEYIRGEEVRERARETNQNQTFSNFRKRVTMTEFWGTIIDPNTGDVLHENCVTAVANDMFVIRPPKPNPLWHGQSPFVVAPVIRVPHSTQHKALMDAPTLLNRALNEIFNLKLDAGIMSVFGVRQIREHWIDNAEEISNGITPGMVLKANASCPPGQQVLETVSTGSLSQESDNTFQMTMGEFYESALTNDLRNGNFSPRAVKATEVIEASQAITSVFTGVAQTIEEAFIEPILNRAFFTMMQHMDDLDSEEMKALLGEKRAVELAALSPEERFEKTANGHEFKVFGITQTLNKIKDFRKLTTLLQTIAQNPTLTEEFNKKYDYSKLLGEIMESLDVNTDKIALNDDDQVMNDLAQAQGSAEGVPVEGMPDMQSQTLQMGSTTAEGDLSAVPQTEFASSVAARSG